jgi:predicted AlkP superfamily pyrophosphatase or phosphodiesterase
MRSRPTAPSFLALAFMVLAHAAGAEPSRHVVMVSVDGLLPASYTKPDALGLQVPNLRRLAAEGAFARGVIGVLPTITYPSHTTLITGVPPRLHGVTTNMIFDPEDRSNGAWNWYASAIRVPTLVHAARAEKMTTATVAWPASVGIGADYALAELWRPGSTHPIDENLVELASTPGLMRKVADARARPFPYPVTDVERVDTAVYILKAYKPSLLLLHLLDVDHHEHEHGPGSPEANAATEAADAAIGRLLGAVKEAGLLERTLFAVVSDHGFLPTAQQIRPNTILKQAGLLTTNAQGKIATWQAVFHGNGGSAALFLKDPADTALAEKVRALVEERRKEPGSGIHEVLGPERIRALGGSDESPLVLDAEEGYTFGQSADGDWVQPGPARGTHGQAPDREPLHASLILTGPGFTGRGDLGVVPMTRIAPTLARHLRLKLAGEADLAIQ